MTPSELLHEKREDILRIASRRGAYNVRVFGSVARGEADAKSDIDLLVDLEPGRSLFDLGGLLMDLQNLLGHEVDVETERGLRERIRDIRETLVSASSSPSVEAISERIRLQERISRVEVQQKLPTLKMARSSLFDAESSRLFLSLPGPEVRIYHTRP